MSDSEKIINHLHERFLRYPVSENSDILDAQIGQGLKNMTTQLFNTNRKAAEVHLGLPMTNGKVSDNTLAEKAAKVITDGLSKAYQQNSLFRDSFNHSKSNESTHSFKKPNGRR